MIRRKLDKSYSLVTVCNRIVQQVVPIRWASSAFVAAVLCLEPAPFAVDGCTVPCTVPTVFIPTELGTLTALKKLSLTGCLLRGEELTSNLSAFVHFLTTLKKLQVNSDKLSGEGAIGDLAMAM